MGSPGEPEHSGPGTPGTHRGLTAGLCGSVWAAGGFGAGSAKGYICRQVRLQLLWEL